VALLLLAACSPQQRMARLLKKHPELVTTIATTVVVTDTITELDTFVIEGDTVLVPVQALLRDTIFKQGRVTLQSRGGNVMAFTGRDTFLQHDTAFVELEVTLPGKVVHTPWELWQIIVFWVPLLLLLVAGVRRLFSNQKRD
jgi:hypothetical protein